MNQNKTALLLLHFGTTRDEAQQRSMTPLLEDIQCRYPHLPVVVAYTSGMIRRILAKREVHIFSVEEALLHLKEEGYTHVYGLPSHLLFGVEYDKMEEEFRQKRDFFTQLQLLPPLLQNQVQQSALLTLLYQEYPLPEDTALLLTGHGTTHFTNCIYSALDYMAKEQGYEQMYFSTIEGYPQIEQVIPLLKKKGFTKVHLVPFLFVAGEHAQEDIFSRNKDSQRSLLEQAGFQVSYSTKGLGELPLIRQQYLSPLEELSI